MVSLPLFQRAEAEAWGNNLDGLIVSPTEYGTASGAQWKLKDGGDTIVFGMSQEPASMFSLVESAAVQRQIAQLVFGVANTQYNYDFQPADVPGGQAQLSTLENGLATNEMVDVKAGDMVYNADGEPAELAQGINVLVDGEPVEYDGTSTLQLPQLTVTYKLNDYVWQDGTPGSIEDVKLAYQINCDKESGAVEFITCESISNVEWGEGLEWTVTYLPGAQPPLYALVASPFGTYPSHQVLSDGRNLKDVPAAEWATLPEIAEMPLSNGPYMITEWNKGESMTLEANPHYAAGTGAQRIIVTFIADTNQAVAQLINGDVDYLEKATLGGGPEVQTVLDAAAAGKVNVELQASPTWEHIDFNLFTK
jgi:ABC-type transport system substrate-binding protein